MAGNQVPVTILTGFLGSGKTTLLNRILKEDHGHRIAVIENEFGEEGVDNDLLLQERDEQIVEMNNGCICCTVRGDLIRILGDLAERREAGEIAFDRVIIETTGMADPGPVAQTFFIDDEIADRYLLDAVITVVDAVHGDKQLDEHTEAQEQVGFADRILMSKVDLADPAAQERLRERLMRINPRAPIKPVNFGNAPIAEILDIRGFNLNAILEIDPEFLTSDEHEHNDAIQSFVFRSKKPFDPAKLEDFLSGVIQVYGPDLLRYKGVLFMKGSDRQTVFQGVHMMMGADTGRRWQPGEKPSSKMVFIGRNLPRDMIVKGLEQCLA
ncbi:CobW family GTP-binding protein [Zeimonas arvi]|uniref:GTP-binding protein n=1 Tax=Zeimonas arvi TaxID=2498847 RepID=A0A5C8NW48_9BURK|nr:GTP-binding protein [Zeimonas arvi]TXL65373.1 GTP-binding protein [Zeimonas arvi]